MNLIRQGYYKEMPYAEYADSSILDFIGKANPEEIEKICGYLNSGIVLITCCGTSTDVIRPENGIAGTPSVLTDGKWVWPGDLGYYVRNYRLALAPEFISDMRDTNWTLNLKETDVDYSTLEIEGKKLFEE
ncbi:MAG: hypothetical protein HUJ69_09605 [Lachnospiraceae bacterium]|nr:hypothetical protein [Lachnospiraceae bacterium]